MFEHRINESLELRIYEQRHAQEVFDACDANREHIAPWLPWIDTTKTIDDTLAFIRRSLEQFARSEGCQCGIWENGVYVGGVGFLPISHAHDRGEIGYWLVKSAEGRGIMTAASRALTDHAFHDLKLNRLEIRAAAGNTRSRAVAERLSFRQDGVLRQALKIRETYHDLVVYGMLAGEWADLRDQQRRLS
jgi:ribosomal-protein-serine acetyltransferase